MGTQPRRSLDGRPLSASPAEGGAPLLGEAAQRAIARLCEYLEGVPPYRVRRGSVACPMRALQRRREARELPWPVPAAEAAVALRELATAEPSVGSLLGWSVAAERGVELAWVGATLKTNVLSEGAPALSRAEAAWFEGLMRQQNAEAAAAGVELRGWQTSTGRAAGLKTPSTLTEDSVPSASLDHLKAQAAPTHPRAQCERHGS